MSTVATESCSAISAFHDDTKRVHAAREVSHLLPLTQNQNVV